MEYQTDDIAVAFRLSFNTGVDGKCCITAVKHMRESYLSSAAVHLSMGAWPWNSSIAILPGVRMKVARKIFLILICLQVKLEVRS